MKYSSARLGAALLALLAAAALQARAEFLDWNYHWSVTPTNGANFQSGPVTISPQPDGSGNALTPIDSSGTLFIPAATITAPAVTPAAYNATYDLTLKITDNTTPNTSGTLTWKGQVQLDNTSPSGLTNILLDTASNPLQAQLTLNGHQYNVLLEPALSQLPTPDANTLLDVQVTVADTGVNSSPEPGGLLLGGFAFSGMGLGCLWRRVRRGLSPKTA